VHDAERSWQNAPSSQLLRAAQYLRMSTEHQHYSINNQAAAIALYAAAHNVGIVRSFVDKGKSGTSIRGRKGLQELLRVVESGKADFDQVLVYDVSRWGRFPDSDEAAHYEYLCKRAGIAVRYCAEQFENDNSTTSNLLKALKRTMAGEYSRELSVKVSAGQRRLASMGWWQGGNGPFGMQRQLVGQDGQPKQLLKLGEWKSIDTDRITLTPGPSDAVTTIQLAFDLYTKKGMSRRQIADILNAQGRFRGKRLWNVHTLRYLFTNPVYKGAYPYCKHNQKYKVLPREQWLVCEHAFIAIIPDRQWEQANARVHVEVKPLVDSEMLEGLRRLWKRVGKLNSALINSAKDIPSTVAYHNHFGGINEAYKLIGFPVPRDMSFIHAITKLREMRNDIADHLCQNIRAVGAGAERLVKSGCLSVNQSITIKVTVATGMYWHSRRTSWALLLSKRPPADITVIARLNRPDHSILDYYVFPAFSQVRGGFHVHSDNNAAFLELYHFPTLQELSESFRQYPTRDAA
jgi:DNA invertase Pin-like site-specific DNA recombinase